MEQVLINETAFTLIDKDPVSLLHKQTKKIIFNLEITHNMGIEQPLNENLFR